MFRPHVLPALLGLVSLTAIAAAAEVPVTVAERPDLKAVFGQVESRDVVPARARIGGTVTALSVEEGSAVKAGDVIALVVDDKLALQLGAVDARIKAIQAQLDNAKIELDRASKLLAGGVVPKTRVDLLQTQFDVLTNQLTAAEADRAVLVQQQSEGEVIAPAPGRVLTVPVTKGSVILPGEPIARIAGGGYFLRLSLPERHAGHIKLGDDVIVGSRGVTELSFDAPQSHGKVVKVYPEIDNGNVLADVEVADLGDFFVGERTRVWIPVAMKTVVSVQAAAIATRAGVDYVKLADGTDVPVIIGQRFDDKGTPAVEILSGLGQGDTVVTPVKDTANLGIAGRLTRAFIQSPLTPLFLLAALAVGLVALLTLPREEEPQISVPMVDIMVQANGLKAEDAVKLVTEPLETIVKSIDGVEHVYSQTRDDNVMVTARFLVGTSSDAAIMRVHEKLRANMDRIPKGIPEPLIVGRGIDDVAIVVLTLSPKPEAAARWTANDVSRVTRELQVELAKLDDIGLTYITGNQPEEIRIEPDPEKLSLYGITLQQLSAKIAAADRSFQARTLRDKGKQIAIMGGQTLQSPSDIANILISARDGRPVYVRDVALVLLTTDSREVRAANVVKTAAGTATLPAVSLALAKRPGTNAVVIAERITERLAQLKGTLIPDDLTVTITRNYGETANEKANELLFHLGLATISIVILVAVAIGWREALVVAVVIPTTILLTLFAARIMGYTLNRVSLFALIFSIGILVDDAIVVIENIARHWAMKDGRSHVDAAVDAVAEVGNPTIVATLTVVAALLPMLFVSGMMGPYMSPIPSTASAAMIFSFFVAVMVTPWLMMKFGGKDQGHGGLGTHEAADGGILGRAYVAVARPIIRSKARAWTFLLLVGLATLASLSLFYTRDVTVKLLPFDNKSELQVVADLPEGSSVEDTARILAQAADVALTLPEVTSVQTYAGEPAPFNFNGLVRHYYIRTSPELGDVQVTLSPKSDRDRSSHDIALELRQKLKALTLPEGTVIKVVEPPPGPPVLATLLAEIYGPDPETRRATAAKVREAFNAVPFVVDTDDSYGQQKPRLRIAIDQDNLEYQKVEEGDVYDTLQGLYADNTVGYSHRGGGRQPIPITVGLPKAGKKVLDERTLSTPVPANALPGARGVVELGDVVSVKQELSSFPIFRHNGKPTEMVTGELAGAFEAPVYGMIEVGHALDKLDWTGLQKPEIALHGQPIDDSKPVLLWDGEWEVTWVTFRDMGGAFMVALLGIYILVVAQFGSFKLPLVILTPIPLTLIGIMLGHWLFHAAFTATSMIGFIALAGIIVRNSILLVDFVRHERKPGADLREVLLKAGAIRFKPILLTALAAMIGAAVILTDPIFQGLAISLLFGLASSTLLTVLVIPAIYIALRYRPAEKDQNVPA